MPETPADNLNNRNEQEQGSGESESSLRAPSSAQQNGHSDTESVDQEHDTTTSSQELREAVFTKVNPSIETEVQPEPEPISFWQKIKHSALYGNKQKAAAAAPSSDRSSRRQNKTGLLIGGVLTVFVAGVWLLYIVSSPVRKPPAPVATASMQQPAGKNDKSLTPGLQAHPNEQQPSGDQGVTAADIRGTASGTMPPPAAAKKSGVANNDPDYALGKIPPPPPPVVAAPAPPVSNQKNPLDTTALVFVRHRVKSLLTSTRTTTGAVEPVSFRPAIALKSEEFESLPTGTRLIARLETPVTTAVNLPAVAMVEYNYEDKDHTLLIPAGSRVFGKLEQADAQGFVGLHFQSIQRPSDAVPTPFEARAIGLNYQPLKGAVSGRNRSRRFLVRAASGVGQMAAATVGMNRGSGGADALNNNVLIRGQLMSNIGSAGDQELQQLAYSEHRVITLAGNTRFYLVVDHEAKQRERRDGQSQQAPDLNSNNASMQAQLVELRKELADVTAKQTALSAGSAPTETLNPANPSEASTPASPPE